MFDDKKQYLNEAFWSRQQSATLSDAQQMLYPIFYLIKAWYDTHNTKTEKKNLN